MQQEISFGEWLRKQRRSLDLSRQAFAAQVGCAEVTLRRIEAGTLKPSNELANILLEKLGILETERPQWISFARGLADFPLPSSPSSNKPITNLPAPLTTFVGREKEQADVMGLIAKHRLVTLTGSGGVGKTRLCIKVGEQVLGNYADGVWLVELASILNQQLVPRTTAITIGLRDEPQRPVIDMLSDYLREKKMLLILDNCEHLLEACTQLADTLLKRCPHLKILATSREVLGILGEATYRVPSLKVPDSQPLVKKLRSYESVRLFEERAQLVRMDFSLTIENASSVAKICNRLDGIPLAIELAAAKVGKFSVEQILKQLNENFNILTGGNRTALPRHHTLRASVDWSWSLLTESERRVMRQLSVFAGGWTLESAQEVCDGDVIELSNSLVRKSIIVMNHETTPVTRFHFHETMRQYANEKLVESGEMQRLRNKHLGYFLKLAESAEPYLIRSEQIEWLPLLDADYENLRFAFEFALLKKTAESSLRLCAALGWFWEIRCYWLEGLNWLKRAVARTARDVGKRVKVARVRALYTRAMLEWQLGNVAQLRNSAEESLTMALEVSDKRDIAIAMFFVGAALVQQSEDSKRALSLLEQSFSISQEIDEPFWQARSFLMLGEFLVQEAKLNYHDAYLQSIALARTAGERLFFADTLSDYAHWLFRNNRVEEAKKYAEEADGLYKQIGSEQHSLTPFLLGDIAWSNGDTQTAKLLFIGIHQRFSLLGEKGFRSNSAGRLGLLAMEESDLDRARVYLEEALTIEREAGWRPWEAYYLIELGNLFYLQGNSEYFRQYVREGFALKPYFSDSHKALVLMTILGSLYFKKPDMSTRLLGAMNTPDRASDFPRTLVEKRYCVRAEAHARKVLGDAAFEALFAEGQKMSLDDGLDLALKIVEEM